MTHTPQFKIALAVSAAALLLLLESPAFSENEMLNYQLMRPMRKASTEMLRIRMTGALARSSCSQMPCSPQFTNAATRQTYVIKGEGTPIATLEKALAQAHAQQMASVSNITIDGYVEGENLIAQNVEIGETRATTN